MENLDIIPLELIEAATAAADQAAGVPAIPPPYIAAGASPFDAAAQARADIAAAAAEAIAAADTRAADKQAGADQEAPRILTGQDQANAAQFENTGPTILSA